MKLTRPIEVAQLAPLQYQARKGEPVYSVGCNQGDPPTIMAGAVNQIDKYLGPPNITASGRPVVGRSGGGLFNSAGELIGVCSAADPEIDEGLYACPCHESTTNSIATVCLSFIKRNNSNRSRKWHRPLAFQISGRQQSQRRPNHYNWALHHPCRRLPPASPPRPKTQELVCVLKSEDGTESQAYVIENPSDVLLDYLQREAKIAK